MGESLVGKPGRLSSISLLLLFPGLAGSGLEVNTGRSGMLAEEDPVVSLTIVRVFLSSAST